MQFPIKDKFSLPTSEGVFGAKRKFDMHTGIDLYCTEQTPVYAIEDGIVIGVENFTGPNADSTLVVGYSSYTN